MSSSELLKQQLEELQKQIGKKQKFEDAVFSINSLLSKSYPSASPSLRKSFYSLVCRVETILKTRYTAPGFWLAGLRLFEHAESLVSDTKEKLHLKNCIEQAKQHLQLAETPPDVSSNSSSGGYLFEGHLTVDPEPPQPQWLVASNLLNSMVNLVAAESSSGTAESHNNILSEIMNNMNNFSEVLDEVQLSEVLMENAVPKPPPASKEVVAKLPVVVVTDEILAKLGQGVECAICKDNLVVDDKMQELPCKHIFHPPCLKPWLDETNSCPICRHELQTDDHAYESWKEREKEAEEERKGAANAVRGGEFLYI